jgi:hypothetical protein
MDIPTLELKWINEDNLPDMENNIYHAMFPASKVDFVRYFPYLEDIDGNRFYLIKLEEA